MVMRDLFGDRLYACIWNYDHLHLSFQDGQNQRYMTAVAYAVIEQLERFQQPESSRDERGPS